MFTFTREDGTAKELDLDIDALLRVRWGDERALSWHDRKDVPGVFSNEVLSNVTGVIGNVNEMRKSPEYKAAAAAWLTASGYEVDRKGMNRLGVGLKKSEKSNNPLNVKHVVRGELIEDIKATEDTPGTLVFTIHPELPEEEKPKKKRVTKSDLETQNAELQATIDRIKEQHGLDI